MKNLLLFSFLTLGLLASCDDDDICIQSDFIGTWVGTEECNGDNIINADTITIMASLGAQLLIDGGRFETDYVDIVNCRLEGTNTLFGTGWKYSGLLKDDVLKLAHEALSFVSGDDDCLYILTKI